MRKKERAEAFFEILKELYPDSICSLEYSTPLQLLIATQLSAQCTDARVNIVTKEANLLSRCFSTNVRTKHSTVTPPIFIISINSNRKFLG